jgi:hypothetical protein
MVYRPSVVFALKPLLTVAILVCLSRAATAQVFELGAGLSRGCIGDSSGFCGDEAGAMWAVHGSLWVSARWQISLRLATLPLPDTSHSTLRDDRFNLVVDPALRTLPRIDITSRERSRQVAAGEALYHFAGGRRFGAVLGIGVGEVRTRLTLSCEPDGCEQVMRALGERSGPITPQGRNLTLIAGLSGPAWARVQLAGGVRLHNLAGEGMSTAEMYLTTAIRFGAF